MSELKERILSFIEEKGMTQRAFEVSCEITIGTLKNVGEGMNSVNIGKIMLHYPELSIRWLLLGEGDMLLKTQNQVSESPEYLELKKKCDDLEEVNRQQQRLLALYLKQMEETAHA